MALLATELLTKNFGSLQAVSQVDLEGGIADEKMGEIPKVYITLKLGEEADEEEIMDYVKDRLAKYKKLRAVEFLDELPKGPTGKILRRELREKTT